MTKLTDHELIVLAAYLGGSNMGFKTPDRAGVQRYLEPPAKPWREATVRTLCHDMWGHLAESDEMLEGFEDECQSWYKDLKKERWDREKVIKVFPDHAAKFW
jgi:hypothetical protein